MKNIHKAYLAGGCFWGLQELFRKQKGIVETRVGYMGGENDNPSYDNHPGHAEALEISYDPELTNYREILEYFFRVHNPTTLNQQGNDKGSSYRSSIFYTDQDQRDVAQETIAMVDASARWNDPVVTTLEPFVAFWMAEEYHQDYLQKNPGGYTCHQEYFDNY